MKPMHGAFLLAMSAASCSSLERAHQKIPFEVADPKTELKVRWTHQAQGPVTDMRMAKDVGAVVYSAIPDSDFPGSPASPRLVRVGSQGKVEWDLPLSSKVKEFDVSDAGDRTVVTTYDEKVQAYDARGKKIWSLDTFCHPIVLGPVQRVLCFFDDDSNPSVAFHLYDWNGKKLWEQPVQREVLLVAVSADASVIAMATTGGTLWAMDLQGKVLLKKRVDGEWVAMAVRAKNGEAIQIAALYHANAKGADRGERLTWISTTQTHALSMEYHAERVAWAGDSVVVYGNSPQGQVYGSFELPADGIPALQWSYREPRFADFSVPMGAWKSTSDVVGWSAGYESDQSISLVGLNARGAAHWQVPIRTEEGSFLYDARGNQLVVVPDGGLITMYELK